MLFFVNTDSERIKFIADHYSRRNQTIKVLEELAELQQAICKLHNSSENGEILNKQIPLKDNVREEIADVVIMLNQLLYLHNIDEAHIVNLINFKLDRQLERIENE